MHHRVVKKRRRIDKDRVARGLGAERRGKVEARGGWFGALELSAESRAMLHERALERRRDLRRLRALHERLGEEKDARERRRIAGELARIIFGC